MSFTYEDFYLSGFNSGSTDNLSGIQKTTPLYWIVTGLKYDGNQVPTGHYCCFRGRIIAGSGTLTEQTGFIGYDEENDYFYTDRVDSKTDTFQPGPVDVLRRNSRRGDLVFFGFVIVAALTGWFLGWGSCPLTQKI